MPANNARAPWPEICRAVAEATGQPAPASPPAPISGGCIHETYKLDGDPPCFVKINSAPYADSFAAESEALGAISATATVRCPNPITSGTAAGYAYLVLSYIEMGSLSGSPAANETLGEQLAAMHRCLDESGTFGWHRDNTIGATAQINPRESDWATFFCSHRLGYQFKLATDSGRGFNGYTKFLDRVHEILSAHDPAPSLLHGDLWGGNAACDQDGIPVIFDPATYYGDRETDLAFTRMFGGFSRAFYRAYHDTWPMPDGHEERSEIYNLYHILNHHHLFGGGYGSQAKGVMRRFI